RQRILWPDRRSTIRGRLHRRAGSFVLSASAGHNREHQGASGRTQSPTRALGKGLETIAMRTWRPAPSIDFPGPRRTSSPAGQCAGLTSTEVLRRAESWSSPKQICRRRQTAAAVGRVAVALRTIDPSPVLRVSQESNQLLPVAATNRLAICCL